MKLIERIPGAQYAYTEAHFDSLEEYKTELPKLKAILNKTEVCCDDYPHCTHPQKSDKPPF